MNKEAIFYTIDDYLDNINICSVALQNDRLDKETENKILRNMEKTANKLVQAVEDLKKEMQSDRLGVCKISCRHDV